MSNKKILQFTALLLGFSALVFWVWVLPAYSQGKNGVDLSIAKHVFPTSVLEPGETIRYTLVISNQGELTATNVVITDVLPIVLTGLDVTGTVPMTQTGNGWMVGTLLPGAREIFTLTAQITSGLTSEFIFTNTATITSPLTDTFPANNQSDVISEVNLPPVVTAGPDLETYPNTLIRLTGSFTDPGLDDTHTVIVNWGDATIITGTVDQVSKLFTVTHTYSTTGLFTATVNLSDNDGGLGVDSVLIHVEPIPFKINLPILVKSPSIPSMKTLKVYPGPETIAPLGSEISSTYNLPVYFESITPGTFLVHASQTGYLTGTYEVFDHTVVFEPEQSLKPGEHVEVVTTEGVQGFELYPIPATSPTLWQFRATSNGGSGFMLPHSSTPSFGSGDSRDEALGDLDHDGDLDLIVVNAFPPGGTVWLNDGAGNFSAHPTTPGFGSGNSLAISLGDLDQDGDLDNILVGTTGETVWLNDGQGNFSAHPTMPGFGNPSGSGIDLGDLDGDGDLDAVVAGSGGEAQTVWLNDGKGGFPAHPGTPVFGEGDSWAVALGDIDSDYDLDAVIANGNGEPETVWLNDGKGNFTPHPTTPSFGTGSSEDVVLGDLDGDRDLDAVIANSAGEPETVWLNNGQGDFTPHPTMPGFGLGDSSALSLADLDGDLDLDIVVANGGDEPETVWLNDGQGNLSTLGQQTGVGSGDSNGVATGDLDGDGDLDFVIANVDQESVWINTEMKVVETIPSGNGGELPQNGEILVTFDAPVDPNTFTPATFVVRGEFTGSYTGIFSFPAPEQVQFVSTVPFKPGENIRITLTRSILAIKGTPLVPYGWSFRAALSGGSGQMILHPESPFGGEYLVNPGYKLGDIDGDSDLDVVQVAETSVGPSALVWLNNGSGSYSSHPIQPGTNGKAVVLGDLDGDGDLDAVYVGTEDWDQVFNSVWLNDGAGGFLPHPIDPSFGEGIIDFRLQLGDLDNDGDLDAVGANSRWINDGSGVFEPQNIEGDRYFAESVLADLDNDGDLDNLSRSYLGLQIWINNGKGSFSSSPLPLEMSDGCWSIVINDADNDHDLDLFMMCPSPYSVHLWLNDGHGNFTPHPTTPQFGDGYLYPTAMGDLDDDGDLDVVLKHSDKLTIWANDGLGNFAPHPNYPELAPQGGNSIQLGDADGDGDLDVLLIRLVGFMLGTRIYLWLNE